MISGARIEGHGDGSSLQIQLGLEGVQLVPETVAQRGDRQAANALGDGFGRLHAIAQQDEPGTGSEHRQRAHVDAFPDRREEPGAGGQSDIAGLHPGMISPESPARSPMVRTVRALAPRPRGESRGVPPRRPEGPPIVAGAVP